VLPVKAQMDAGYLFFGPTVGLSASFDLARGKLGRFGIGLAVVGDSKIYNVDRPRDYEGAFSGVSGNISIPPFVFTDTEGPRTLLFNKAAALFWSPFPETVDPLTGDVKRPAWGWRVGNGVASKFVSIP
jgi:hypothetical protein